MIDTRPFEIRLRQATATLQSSEARLALSKVELWRAQQLKATSFGTVETVDQRQAEQEAASASVASATQAILDARLDLEFCHVTAPFTGRISNHLVSVGDLVSGSRGGSRPTTLLTTIVSLDPIYIDFDMSQDEFIKYQVSQGGHASGG
ncbi:efflux RND transporter periplasmic adaptor subunit [Rhodopila sp.]|uniref:efflux RND transporter periplasmic adaptor subunit n=1 Tax=Rhodopila sp. TaxID=2480087 RepID=UPI003D0F93F9